MVEQKWIINNGKLILGLVEFHEELHLKSMNKNKTIGGGRWILYKDINTICFYGKSIQYGKVTKEQFDTAIKQRSLKKLKIIFTENDYPISE